MSGSVRLLRRPLVRASSSVAGAAGAAASPLPSAHDLGVFHAKLDRMGAPVRARDLAALQASASALAREQDTLGTLPRQLAHMLLVRPVVRPSDLLDPAAAWGDVDPREDAIEAEGAAGAAAAATAPEDEARAPSGRRSRRA